MESDTYFQNYHIMALKTVSEVFRDIRRFSVSETFMVVKFRLNDSAIGKISVLVTCLDMIRMRRPMTRAF